MNAESKSPPVDGVVSPISLAIIALVSSALVLALEAISFQFPVTSRAFWGMVWGFVPALALCTLPFVGAKVMQRIPRLSVSVRKWMAAGLVGLCFALPLKWVGDSLIIGGWVSQQRWAHWLPWGVVLAGAVGLTILSRIWLQERWQKYLILPFVALGLALIIGEALVLPGLYQVPRYAARLMGQEFLVLALWPLRFAPASKPWMRRASTGVGVLMILAASVAWIKLPRKTNMEMSFRGGVATNLRSISAVGSEPSTPINEILRAKVPWTAAVQTPPARRAKHVVLLLVDTLRADALSPAREEPGARKLVTTTDTPFLNKFMAEECSVFRRVYAQAPATHRSIPPTFRSVEAWENGLQTGTSLGTHLTQEGVNTFAVVNEYFVLPWYDSSTALLDGFQDLNVYFAADQDRGVTLAKEAFGRNLTDTPSFGWIHFLAPHYPGWNKKLLRNLKPRPRYRQAVRWIDGAIKDLVEDLRAKGALEDTAIIIASDHGEGLGDNGTWNHGPNVWDEEVRVPMAICLPGQKGALIERTVGNIDLQPTLLDILGLPKLESSRGRSLMPLLEDPQASWENPYYVENFDRTLSAMIFKGQKLIFRVKSDAYSRYDLLNDPDEETNVFDPEGKADRELQMLMAHWNPLLVKGAVSRDDSALVAASIEAWRGQGWDPKLNLVLELAAQLDTPPVRAAVTNMWKDAGDDSIRFWIMRSLRSKQWLAKLVKARIEGLEGADLSRFVGFVADAHLAAMDANWVLTQVNSVSTKNEGLWVSWMRLVASWKLQPKSWGDGLAGVIAKGQTFDSALANDSSFWPLESLGATKPGEALLAQAAKHAESSSAHPRAASIRILGLSGDQRFVPNVQAALSQEDIPFVVRQTAVYALARLEGKAATPLILAAMTKDPLLTVDGLKAIASTGDLESLVELKKTLHYGFDRFIDPEIERLKNK